MKIRKATRKDIGILTDFCYREEKLHIKFDKYAELKKDAKKRIYKFLKSNIANRNYAAFVAEDKNKIVGIIAGAVQKSYFTYKIANIGHLGTAFVLKEYRNMGIAKELLKRAISWFKSKNIKTADLYVHKRNKIAFNAWKKYGFEEIICLMRKEI